VLPTPTGGDVLNGDPHNPTHWDDSPDIVIDTTGAVRITPPTEVELAKIPAAGPATDRARVSTTNRQVKVHVLVHHRWSDSLPSAQVKVALLRQVLSANGVVQISLLWPALVTAAPSAVEPTSLPDGWTKAAATLWQSPSDGIDSRVPRAVTFDVDLSAESSGSVVAFLAVVMSLPDQISADDLSLGGARHGADRCPARLDLAARRGEVTRGRLRRRGPMSRGCHGHPPLAKHRVNVVGRG